VWVYPPAPEPEPEPVDFWNTRPAVAHIHQFARARRVGPWALFGCILVRVMAATTPKICLPPLIGGPVSLNSFVAIVSDTGDGKGVAESAALDAIDCASTPVLGPGSGEGLSDLFVYREKDETVQHATAVILSAAEVDTLGALKMRPSSTLLPELRKGWMGEQLGFAYRDPAKRLTVERHAYRLCLLMGLQ